MSPNKKNNSSFLRSFCVSRVEPSMTPLSDKQLSDLCQHWQAPQPPANLVAGVWARVDAATAVPHWFQRAWAFRVALSLTVLLWIAAAFTPARANRPAALSSLTLAVAQASESR